MKLSTRPKGSILIWTVLLGISLMTVFFYFSQRLNLNAAVQNKSIRHQNDQLFLQSYADYLKKIPANQLQPGQIDFEGIKGFITNIRSEMTGTLDIGQSVQYEIKYGKAKVEWAKCSQDEQGRLLEVSPNEGLILGNCVGFEYDGLSEVPEGPFYIKALDAPVSYRITPLGKAILYDSVWTYDLSYLGVSKKNLSLSGSFLPTSE